MKTETEIVIETLQHYSDPTNRATTRDGNGHMTCLYTAHKEDGTHTHCAVGRCMTEEALREIGSAVDSATGIADAYGGGSLEDLLQEEYRGHPMTFWDSLQALHDTDKYWLESACCLHSTPAKERFRFISRFFPEALQPALDLGLIPQPN